MFFSFQFWNVIKNKYIWNIKKNLQKKHKYYRQTKRVRQERLKTIIKREKEAKMKLTKITSSHDEPNFVDERI